MNIYTSGNMKEYQYCTCNPANYGKLKEFAKENKKHATEAESIMWHLLKNNSLGFPFRRQHIIGDFIADFVCLPKMLIIELDGGYHQLPEQSVKDEERTLWLNNHGFEVIRFTNEQIVGDTDNVLRIIKKKLYEQ